MDIIKDQLKEANELLSKIINDEILIKSIADASRLMVHSLKNEKKIISCGNGGSMCDAMHFAEELTGKYREERKSLAAISISDPSHITCVGNDFGFEYIFSRQIEALGNKNDFLITISTSGKSKNIIEALKKSSEMGIESLVLVGQDSSTVEKYSNHIISIPSEITGVVQQAHITIGQLICKILEDKIT